MTLALSLALAAQLASPESDAGGSYRYESLRTHIRLDKDGFEERQMWSVILLNSVAAVREHGQIGFPFEEGRDEVVIDEIVVQKPDGRTVVPKELLPEVISPFGVNSLGIASDLRVRKVEKTVRLVDEDEANGKAITVRCLIRPDGSMPDSDTEPHLIAILARSY